MDSGLPEVCTAYASNGKRARDPDSASSAAWAAPSTPSTKPVDFNARTAACNACTRRRGGR